MRRAAFYIAQNPEKVIRSTIRSVAKASGSGESTIIRLCQNLGYEGFGEFKLELAQEIERERVLHFPRHVQKESSIKDARLRLIASELQATIQTTASGTDTEHVADLAERLLSARKIAAFGISVSGICAEVLATRLAYLGVTMTVPRSGDLALATAMSLNQNDVALGFSYYGMSTETVAFLNRAKSSGCSTYAFTTAPLSPLAGAADTVIDLAVFGAWPKDGSARLLPSVILLTEFIAALIEDASGTRTSDFSGP
jgi:DNA-binding MurR/RpiR family transcriptional regulator